MAAPSEQSQVILRGTGLLVIEVLNSNPNGDPDRESDPRQRHDGRGEISPVSFKRKLRDLVEAKDGPVWATLSKTLNPPLEPQRFHILESRGRDRAKIGKEIEDGQFVDKYWDGRLFGNTFLEEGASTSIRTGVAQFGLGLSVAPVEIERMTNTNKAGVQEGKDRGMAPLGYRIVKHGVYCMPFFLNPTAAVKSGCTTQDIDLLLSLIPYAYSHTASYVRPCVGIRHAWYMQHKSPLGSCSDFRLLSALTPQRKGDAEKPSGSWDDYCAPERLPEELRAKLDDFRDLMDAV